MKARVLKGGPGSGHHGHAGIPGHRGGSLPGSGSGGGNASVTNAAKLLGLSDGEESTTYAGMKSTSYVISDMRDTVAKMKANGWEVEYKDSLTVELSNEDGLAASVTENRVKLIYRDSQPSQKDLTAIESLMDPLDSKNSYSGKFTDTFTNAERQALSNYKTEGYRSINRQLRAGSADSSQIKQLDSILSESKIGMDGYVFRGIKLTDSGSIKLDDPAYTSWTADSFVAMDFAKSSSGVNTLLALKVGSNDSGIRVDRVTKTMTDEYEVLLPRALRFKEINRTVSGNMTLIEVDYDE